MLFRFLLVLLAVNVFATAHVLASDRRLTCFSTGLENLSDGSEPAITRAGPTPEVLLNSLLVEAREQLKLNTWVKFDVALGSALQQELSFLETQNFVIVKVGDSSFQGRMALGDSVNADSTTYSEFVEAMEGSDIAEGALEAVPLAYGNVRDIFEETRSSLAQAKKPVALIADSEDLSLLVSIIVHKELLKLGISHDFFSLDLSCVTRTRIPLVIPIGTFIKSSLN